MHLPCRGELDFTASDALFGGAADMDAAHVGGGGGGGGHALGGGAVYEYMNGHSHVVGGYADTYNAAFGVAADARGASGGSVTGGGGVSRNLRGGMVWSCWVGRGKKGKGSRESWV